ncbi:hypothetical protein HID58_044131, partial [Brassica napus]
LSLSKTLFQIPSFQNDRVLCNFPASFAAPAIIHRCSNKIQPDGEEKRSQKGFSSKKTISSLQNPISEPAAGSENTNIVAASPMSTESSSDSQTPKEDAPPLITASASKLQDPPSEPTTGSGKNNTVDAVNSEKVILMTNPEEFQTCDGKEEATFSKMELGGTSLPAGIRASASKGAHPPDLGSPETSPAESDSLDIDSPQSLL